MRDFTKLVVWQRSEDLADRVGVLVGSGRFGRWTSLADQLDRASRAIGALIAEGSGAATRRHYATYLDRAAMSANEVEHHLRVSLRRGAIDRAAANVMLDEVGQIRRMLVALRKRVLSEPD